MLFFFQILFLKQRSDQDTDLRKCARTMLRGLFAQKIAITSTLSRKSGDKVVMEKDLPVLKKCIKGKYRYTIG